VWRYAGLGVDGRAPHHGSYSQNTTILIYRLIEGGPIRLELRPALQFRGHDEPVSTAIPEAYPLQAVARGVESPHRRRSRRSVSIWPASARRS